MIRIIDWLLMKLGYDTTTNTPRKELKDVKPGEWIIIEHNRMEHPPGPVCCVSNDPKTKRIVIVINWTGGEKRNYVMDYSDKAFTNFHLLNSVRIETYSGDKKEPGKPETGTDLTDLQKRMNEALEKEDYETAEKIQQQIDKLQKK